MWSFAHKVSIFSKLLFLTFFSGIHSHPLFFWHFSGLRSLFSKPYVFFWRSILASLYIRTTYVLFFGHFFLALEFIFKTVCFNFSLFNVYLFLFYSNYIMFVVGHFQFPGPICHAEMKNMKNDLGIFLTPVELLLNRRLAVLMWV